MAELGKRGCDDEVAEVMDNLNHLQTTLLLQGQYPWAKVVQDARVLIVERCFPVNMRMRTEGNVVHLSPTPSPNKD